MNSFLKVPDIPSKTPKAEGPAVWSASELRQDRSWVIHFSASEISELEAALTRVTNAQKSLYGFGRDEFHLPTLGLRFRRCAEQIEQGRGVVLWRGLNVENYDEENLKALYWGIGVHLGDPISQNAKGDLIGHVRDSGRDYMSKNVRGYTT